MSTNALSERKTLWNLVISRKVRKKETLLLRAMARISLGSFFPAKACPMFSMAILRRLGTRM